MKDTNNLLTVDQWSCTEYTGSTTGFIGGDGSIREPTNIWSKIGESSLKATKTGTALYGFRVSYEGSLTGTVTGKLTLLTKSNENVTIVLYASNANEEIIEATASNVISNNIPVTVSLSIPTNNNAVKYELNISNNGSIGCVTFVDDISLTAS